MKPNTLIENILRMLRKMIPPRLFTALQPFYHTSLAFINAILYRFPSRKINIVAVTGTKGKTSVTEFVDSILTEAGYKTALLNTIRFKIGNEEYTNTFKMSTPGRGFVQHFLRKAATNRCDWVIMELTSQAVLLSRHKHIELNSLIFTNISPEHIEAHGSFEDYLKAKLEIAKSLQSSPKQNKTIISNVDDEHGTTFIKEARVDSHPFSLEDARPYSTNEHGSKLTFKGHEISTHLPGLFNIYNMLAAATFADSLGINPDVIKKGIEKKQNIRGRLECINPNDTFGVYVDYAHTPDSLEKVYKTFPERRKICVLGNTGGGRDTWKRSVMAEIADTHCDSIIFSNEDPYDEDPEVIVQEMYNSVAHKEKAEVILDRREAIHEAITRAKPGDVVLITGKGTDPYIMGPDGSKIPWDDAAVAREELEKVKSN